MTSITKLPSPPPEPPACTDVQVLAPAFKTKLTDALLDLAAVGWRPIVRETYRSNERAAWLYGFGRSYDDGRGIVTHATTALDTWHHYKLAADVGDRRFEPGNEPPDFWAELSRVVAGRQLTWGGSWHMQDRPHVQWWCDGMHVSPSTHAADLLASGGIEAVWRELHAL